VLDGEVAVFDKQHRFRFEWRHQRRPPEIAMPPVPSAFEMLHVNRRDVSQRPLRERRARLEAGEEPRSGSGAVDPDDRQAQLSHPPVDVGVAAAIGAPALPFRQGSGRLCRATFALSPVDDHDHLAVVNELLEIRVEARVTAGDDQQVSGHGGLRGRRAGEHPVHAARRARSDRGGAGTDAGSRGELI